jgi:endogenous inhibitor of DNA gyrase (YacG/DUF329 family)
MKDVLVRCPQCKHPVIFKTSTGLFVSSRAVEATTAKATIKRVKCRTCRTWVEIGQERFNAMVAS